VAALLGLLHRRDRHTEVEQRDHEIVLIWLHPESSADVSRIVHRGAFAHPWSVTLYPTRAGVRFPALSSDAPLAPQFRAWLEDERVWGRHAVDAIATQRRLLLANKHGLDRFAIRMALVDLNGSVARWARNLHDGLIKVDDAKAAAVFAISPPFVATDPTIGDCDLLSEYVEVRIDSLRDLLARDST
jgi:hypothetical protein